jgi:DNA-binding MarR family transcriptional regulator
MKTSNSSDQLFRSIIELNRTIHEPARISVMTLLSVVESADFLFIMNQTGLTQGNLSFHLSKLEAAGYVLVEKTFRNKRPNTLLKLSAEGRKEFRAYIRTVSEFIGSISV